MRMPNEPNLNLIQMTTMTEEEFKESTGNKCNHNVTSNSRHQGVGSTGKDSILEPTQINHEIYTLMKNLMQQCRLMKAPKQTTCFIDDFQ